MKFTNISVFAAAVACSAPFSSRDGGESKIFVAAAGAEKKMDRSRHASAIASLAGNEAIEFFHKDLHQAARAIEERKEARDRSLRVLLKVAAGEGTCEEEL